MRSIENFISSKIEKFVNELTELKKIFKNSKTYRMNQREAEQSI